MELGLAAIKDPFGYITRMGYDAKHRLGSVSHSTLGTAAFAYDDADGRLLSLTLGNGAKTLYGYDELERLTSFDIREADDDRILKHSWSYDILGRKDASEGIAIESDIPGWGVDQYDFSYDAASRVTSEHAHGGGGDAINESYAYDTAGNRTELDRSAPEALEAFMGYGAGNREETVDADTSGALQYDFKGNVTRRPELGADVTHTYEWDAYDRLVRAGREGDSRTAEYVYDPNGRLSLTTEPHEPETSSMKTAIYWLGLNRLATETFAAGADEDLPVVRVDDCEGTSTTANGWSVVGYMGEAAMAYEQDAARGGVLHLTDTGIAPASGKFMLGDNKAGNANSADAPLDIEGRGVIGLWVKNEAVGQPFKITAVIEDNQGDEQQITWTTDGATPAAGSDGCWYASLPTLLNDGAWHYIDMDAASDLAEARATGEPMLAKIHGLVLQTSNLYVDDIAISSGRLDRSYEIAPGKRLGAILAAQTGAQGAFDVDTAEECIEPWGGYGYLHNELGTVVSTTTSDGNVLGLYQPNYFGNYAMSSKIGSKPDTMGITGKFYDPNSDLYYFSSRWYDAQRGRWASKEPSGLDGPNLYNFGFGQVPNGFDKDGRFWWFVFGAAAGGVSLGIIEYYNGGSFWNGFGRGVVIGGAVALGATGMVTLLGGAEAAFLTATAGGVIGGALVGGIGGYLECGTLSGAGWGAFSGGTAGAIGGASIFAPPLRGFVAGFSTGTVADSLDSIGQNFDNAFPNSSGEIEINVTGTVDPSLPPVIIKTNP